MRYAYGLGSDDKLSDVSTIRFGSGRSLCEKARSTFALLFIQSKNLTLHDPTNIVVR
jgi:hypothetical protein